MLKRLNCKAFTVVELLLIISVVAILASTTIVAYHGVQMRNYDSSLASDMMNMDKAQKYYITRFGKTPVEYSSTSNNDILAFRNSEGNSLIVRLRNDGGYCIYGYNPKSHFPTPDKAAIRSSGESSGGSSGCDGLPALTAQVAESPSASKSTVDEIGRRLERFRDENGRYPFVNELAKIGLKISPSNTANANQHQLYCRNDERAIYLQREDDVAYVYQTQTKALSQINDPGKITVDDTCPKFQILSTDTGYQASGITKQVW